MRKLSLAKSLKEARIRQSLSIQDVTNKTEYSRSYVGQIEKGYTNMTHEVFVQVCDSLEVPPGIIMLQAEIDLMNASGDKSIAINLIRSLELILKRHPYVRKG